MGALTSQSGHSAPGGCLGRRWYVFCAFSLVFPFTNCSKPTTRKLFLSLVASPSGTVADSLQIGHTHCEKGKLLCAIYCLRQPRQKVCWQGSNLGSAKSCKHSGQVRKSSFSSSTLAAMLVFTFSFLLNRGYNSSSLSSVSCRFGNKNFRLWHPLGRNY